MQEYHSKAKRGMKLLLMRQVALQIVSFAGGVILARVLGPAEVGLYLISVFVINLFTLVGDFGLGPSLVQRKGELTEIELQVAFTVQQIIISTMVLILLLAAPFIAKLLYPDIPQVVWLIRALCINLYLSSWRTISALRLERQLNYDRLARIEVLEAIVYQVLAVLLALLGFRVWSFVVASVVQGFIGASLLYLAMPWRVRLRLDRKIIMDLMRFGVPFQIQIILNSMGNWVTPLLVGRVVGPVGVGYVNWASSNGRKPMIVADNIMRVGFPHFSRIQEDRVEVERIITKYLCLLLLLIGLWFSLLCAMTPSVIQLIYGKKWTPAALSLLLFSAAGFFDVIGMVVGVALNAIGLIGRTTKIITIRAALNIALGIALVLKIGPQHGFNGIGIGYLISNAMTLPWLVVSIAPGAAGRILRQIAWIGIPVACGVAAGCACSHLTAAAPIVFRVVASGAVAATSFGLASWIAGPQWIRHRAAEMGCRVCASVRPMPVVADNPS